MLAYFCILKGTVPCDFRRQFFFHELVSFGPLRIYLGRFEFFRKPMEIFTAQGAPPVSLTPVATFGVVDTGGAH